MAAKEATPHAERPTVIECVASEVLVDPPVRKCPSCGEVLCPACGQRVRLVGEPASPRYAVHNEPGES